ncbi:P pilus assembly/Cpx signaling pathway, periplasmic inhibitor/zinc-resistance associated protein [Burkholderiales bacterium JOSHI_001]|nr:P pilus assembly/Cpx signaling pathway, periplasmic inhibitor/zinc-resistance associated protein [Burkholderiales bacterium JOSHI_001]
MKTSIRRTLIGLAGATVLVGSLAAFAQNGPGAMGGEMGGMGGMMGGMGHHRHGPMNEADAAKWRERMTDRVADKLQLDAAQKAKFATLTLAMAEQRKALMPEAGDMKAQAKALLAGPRFDRAGAQAMVDAKTRAIQDKSPAVIAAAGDFYDSLKPEQQQKVRDFLERRGGHHGPRDVQGKRG